MKMSECFPSKFLKAADLPAGREARLTISYVEMQPMEQTGDAKPVAFFENQQKGLVLNVTNAGTIAESYGDETDAWIGRQIILYAARTTFAGRPVPCLRVRIPGSVGEGNAALQGQQVPRPIHEANSALQQPPEELL